MPSRLLRRPDFRLFMLGRVVSELGSRITREGLPIVAILAVGATASELGLLAALTSVVAIAAAPFGGLAADRHRRRPIMIAADLVRALALATVPLAALAHRLTFLQIAAVAALVGGLTVVFDVADQAWLPQFVTRRRLAAGNAAVASASAVGETGGPALMGALIQWVGAPFAIGFDAVSYVLSAASLLAIRGHDAHPGPASAGGGRGAVRALRVVLAHPLLRPLALTLATQSLFGGFFEALYEIFALRTLHLSPLTLGLLITAGGAGALVGSSLAPAAARRLGTGGALVAGALGNGVLAFLVPLAGGPFIAAFGALLAAQLCGDLAGTIFEVNERVLRQTVTPDAWLGRVNGSGRLLAGAGSALGALLGGALATAAGNRAALLVAAAGLTAAPLWLLFSRIAGSVRPGPIQMRYFGGPAT